MARKTYIGRVRRKDPKIGKRLRNAALLFAASMVGFGVSLALAMATAHEGVSDGWPAFFTFVFLLAIFAATVHVIRVRVFYRCPKCRTRSWQAPGLQAGEPLVFLCSKCNVEWDTGWTVADSGD